MQRDKMKGESGVSGNVPEDSSTSLWTDTANAKFKGNKTARAKRLHDAGDVMRAPQAMVRKEDAAMTDDSDNRRGDICAAFEAAAKPSVEIDVEKYQALLDDPDLSDTQKEEIMHALWMVMMAFVDLGFGVHPAQEVCGKPEQTLDVSGYRDSNEP